MTGGWAEGTKGTACLFNNPLPFLAAIGARIPCNLSVEGYAVRSAAARYQPNHVDTGLEPARMGFHRIVADILRRAPAEDAARIAWQLVCGTQVSQRTTALGMENGVLRVRVPDADWRTQLADFVPQYLLGLNSMLSHRVNHIEFVLPEKKAPHRA